MRLSVRRLLFGEPLPTARLTEQKLPKVLALPVFASDALSSTAYGPEEVLIVLYLAGAAGLAHAIPIGIAVVTLVGIVTISYRQTVHAYPSGGGSYIVAKDNLGVLPGLIAASSLLIDYILTVAVSIAAGVAAITSAYPALWPWRVTIALGFVALVAIGNLRGAKESGLMFSIPTYAFVCSFGAMLAVGAYRWLAGAASLAQPPVTPPPQVLAPVTIFLILKAFSSGCSALTGLEAVSNGVQAFRPPESRNAGITLLWMGGILGTLVLGLTLLARHYGITPPSEQVTATVASRLAEAVVGKSWLYYLVQWSTAGILVLAANTAFADFPRLSAILARDGFAPRQLRNLGDRLVFANGILILATLASLLIVIFGGITNRLIPLYAVGVFLSFTLSQAGMVRHWLRTRERGWRAAAAVNAVGATATAVVLVVIGTAKFVHGAFAVILLIPILVMGFLKVHSHYQELAQQLSLAGFHPQRFLGHHALVLVGGVHRGVVTALLYARTIDPQCEAVYVEIDPAETPLIKAKWAEWGTGVPLTILPSPWRSLTQPLFQYLATVRQERHLDLLTVVIPEFATTRWWHKLLHNQSGLVLKWRLMFQPNVVVVNVRYQVGEHAG